MVVFKLFFKFTIFTCIIFLIELLSHYPLSVVLKFCSPDLFTLLKSTKGCYVGYVHHHLSYSELEWEILKILMFEITKSPLHININNTYIPKHNFLKWDGWHQFLKIFIFGCTGSSLLFVYLCGLSLVAASWGYSSLRCVGFSHR